MEENTITMDEFLSSVIGIFTSERLPQIAYTQVDQHISKVTRYKEQTQHNYMVGSSAEGMNNNSDIDVMVVMSIFPVVLWPSQTKGENKNGNFVFAEQNPVEPAYLKLRVVDQSCTHEKYRSTIDKNGYFQSTSFITSVKCSNSGYISDSPNPEGLRPNFKIQGPSIQGAVKLMKSLDNVYCLKCQSWPSSISCEYFNRERQNKWPPQKLLDKISHLDCHVVPVGHPSSASKDIEWRLSFSLAEKELIQRMSKQFFNCMYALKSVKQKYIVYSESDKPTPFCSYFIKTACFYMYETLPNQDYSIMTLIRRVLDWLIDSYKNRNLPHYFISEQNLIGHLSVERCDDVIAKLTTVKRNIWTMVLTSVDDKYLIINQVVGLCNNLKIPGVSGDDDYKNVVSILLNNPKTTEFLDQCISKRRLSDYILKQNAWAETRFHSTFIHLDLLIKQRAFSEMLRCPEEKIIPIVEDIDEIVPEGYGDIFKTRLYRLLGDMYTYILIYLRKIGFHDYPTSYQNKPLQYYTLGAKMMYLHEWSDRCIGGRALKVQYHYLMGNYKTLEKTVDWKPVLCKLKENEFLMHTICKINIDIESIIVQSAWDIDKKLQQCFEHTFGAVAVHPIVFIFYVMAKVHLREGELEKASAIVQEMNGCLKNITHPVLLDTTTSMIELIEIEILELRRMLYCSNVLTPLERPALVHTLYSPTQ
ncbi:uncharacterized protein LOC117106736 [Anneissia japonica]|uniref:uncharacterized protein LOC117106736 n=1 Tax=Anneissia japonica TaxID=1529436 RepID=UPI001425BB40|nr:uncharacterized protein LOC117106736 [Anneissia japonica]